MIIIIITDIVLLLTVNISTNFFTNDHNLSLIFNPETLHTQGEVKRPDLRHVQHAALTNTRPDVIMSHSTNLLCFI